MAAADTGMTGAQALVSTLADHGVTACFANPGTSEMHLVTALDHEPRIHSVLCLFEGVATGAADGHARVTGGPAMTQDDQVRDDQASAARLCACLGYATATVERTDAQCFTSPHDNGIWWWEAASTTWASAGASHQDGCLKVVQCTQPVAACADLIIVD